MADTLRNKNVYKIFLSLIKYVPTLLAILQIVSLCLSYAGITSFLVTCLSGTSIVFLILLYLIAEVFKFLVNIIFYIFRMVFVGFTAIVDNLITYVVRSITGDDTASFFKDATSGWRNDGKEVPKVNIETIIFDDTFDVNFFKPATTTP